MQIVALLALCGCGAESSGQSSALARELEQLDVMSGCDLVEHGEIVDPAEQGFPFDAATLDALLPRTETLTGYKSGNEPEQVNLNLMRATGPTLYLRSVRDDDPDDFGRECGAYVLLPVRFQVTSEASGNVTAVGYLVGSDGTAWNGELTPLTPHESHDVSLYLNANELTGSVSTSVTMMDTDSVSERTTLVVGW